MVLTNRHIQGDPKRLWIVISLWQVSKSQKMAKPNHFWKWYIGRFWYFDVSNVSGENNLAFQGFAKMVVFTQFICQRLTILISIDCQWRHLVLMFSTSHFQCLVTRARWSKPFCSHWTSKVKFQPPAWYQVQPGIIDCIIDCIATFVWVWVRMPT